MMRLLPIFLGFCSWSGNGTAALAASAKATALRQANGLTAFTPPEKFLAGNFVADEMNPGFIFGPVKAFAASRKCPTDLAHRGGRPRTARPGLAARTSRRSIPSTWRRTARTRWSTMSS